MKKLLTQYTFNPTVKTITLLDNTIYNLNQLLLITNVTSNIIVYNFADPLLGGTISNNIISLACNTSFMNSNDSLQIFVDVQNTNELLLGLTYQMRELIETVQPLNHVDASNRQRIAVDAVTSGAVILGAGTAAIGSLTAGTAEIGKVTQTLADQQMLGEIVWDTQRSNLTF